MTVLKPNGDIINENNEKVGTLKWNGNTLVDLFIYNNYRNNGYATDAIRQMIGYINDEGYDYIQTTKVVHGGMKYILREKCGFIPKEKYNHEFSDKIKHKSGIEISQNKNPIYQENCWIKIL